MIRLAPAPASRFYFCWSCRSETKQRLVAQTNGRHPRADHYLCGRCASEVLSLADVLDAIGLCLNVAESGRRAMTEYGDVRSGEREDLIAHLRLAIWLAYLSWDPARSPTFLPYATIKLRQAAIDWDRERRGRVDQGKSPKPLSLAVSLDAPPQSADGGDAAGVDRLLAPLGEVAVDDPAYSLADLRRAVAGRGRELAREDALVGRQETAGATARDRGATCRAS